MGEGVRGKVVRGRGGERWEEGVRSEGHSDECQCCNLLQEGWMRVGGRVEEGERE